MNFEELSLKRSSVRAYKKEVPSRRSIEELLKIAQLAPSAVNRQPWKVWVISSEDAIKKVRQSYSREWFATAPLYLLIFADTNVAWVRAEDRKSHAEIDVAIYIEHLSLAAAEMGLGTCWVCNFLPSILSNNFSFPQGFEPVAILPIGYPEQDELFGAIKNRKDLDENIVSWL